MPELRSSMGLLDKLWDETLAGPRPDSGLGLLRKPSALRSSAQDGAASAGERRSNTTADGSAEEETPRVTRSIIIKRPSGWASPGTGATPPSSPARPTPPVSPFGGAAGKEWNWFSRRSMSDAHGRGGEGTRSVVTLVKPPSPRILPSKFEPNSSDC